MNMPDWVVEFDNKNGQQEQKDWNIQQYAIKAL